MISKKTKWVSTSAWRGYSEPINAVAGANDTGTWSDSPCPSDVASSELNKVKKELKKAGIRYVSMTTPSSNVFCAHRYLLVNPEDKEKALQLVDSCLPDTRLLYKV